MPHTNSDGLRIHWREDGRKDGTPVLLIGSLGTDLGMWSTVTALLAPRHRVIRLDLRGHGASETPFEPFGVEALARDAVAVLDAACVSRAHVCGLSLGALVATHLVAHVPERVASLALCNIAKEFDSRSWQDRARFVRASGMQAFAEMAIGRLFSEPFVNTASPTFETIRSTLADSDAEGYAGCCDAIADAVLLPKPIDTARFPTLVIGGELDVAAPVETNAARIAEAIPGSTLVLLRTGHLSAIEMPEPFARHLEAHIAQSS